MLTDHASIFALEDSIIVLRASHLPMTLQTSPVLSTPHFILLHIGHFTVLVQRQRLQMTGKTVAFAFPGKNPIGAEKEHVPTVTLSEYHSKYSEDIYSEAGVYLTSSAKISLAVGNLAVCLLFSFLPVCVFVCDRAPHCDSDVSSLCPYSVTVTPS